MKSLPRYVDTIAGSLIVSFALITPGEAAVEGIPCTPEPTDMVIKYGDLINCSIDFAGDDDVFRFAGVAGETIVIQKIDATVYAPDGTRVGCNVDTFISGVCSLTQTGTHTILVSGDDAIRYTFALERVAPPSETAQPIQFGKTINDEINGIGDIDLFFFTGEAGDTVNVQTAKLGPKFASILVRIFEPDGARSACDTVNCSLSQTGIHTILVWEYFNMDTIPYALTIQCVGMCSPPSVPDVSGCVKLQGTLLANRRVDLVQTDEPTQSKKTNAKGCYKFKAAVPGKKFQVIIRGPAVP
jgi:hypothetical protein